MEQEYVTLNYNRYHLNEYELIFDDDDDDDDIDERLHLELKKTRTINEFMATITSNTETLCNPLERKRPANGNFITI